MKRKTISEAQSQLSQLIATAREHQEPVMITDDRGYPLGVLAPITDDDIDDMLAQSPSFLRFVEARFSAGKAEGTLSLEHVKEQLSRLED